MNKIAPIVLAAKEAGAAILRNLPNDLKSNKKNDGSPVTTADKAADAIIKKRLRQFTPDIPIISEEDTPAERAAAIAMGGDLKWVVDPLDGTNTAIGYAKGNKNYDGFGVHIALVKNGIPMKGVAFFPSMEDGRGVVYYTGDNGNAYKQVGNDTPQIIRTSKPPLKAEGLRATVHFHEKRRPKDIAGRNYVPITGVGGQRLCLVAEGAADVADMNDIPLTHRGEYAYKQWDLAAAHAILKAAGGELVDAETKQPVTYHSSDFKMPGSFAGACETLKLLGLASFPALGRSIA